MPASSEQLRAGLELYRRAYPASEKLLSGGTRRADPAAGGDHAMGRLIPRLAESLRGHGCANVSVEVIKDSGHWVVDEQPELVAALIERHASR